MLGTVVGLFETYYTEVHSLMTEIPCYSHFWSLKQNQAILLTTGIQSSNKRPFQYIHSFKLNKASDRQQEASRDGSPVHWSGFS
jgi:hypothetical protein